MIIFKNIDLVSFLTFSILAFLRFYVRNVLAFLKVALF